MTVAERIAALEAGRSLESPLADLPKPSVCEACGGGGDRHCDRCGGSGEQHR